MSANSSSTTFEAGAFHPDHGTRRVAGRMSLEGGLVRFEAETLQFTLPVEGLTVRLGGASDRLIFFEHPEMVGISVFTSDRTVLEQPAFAQNAALGRARGKIRQTQWLSRGLLFAVMLALAAVLAGIWLAKDSMVESVAAKIPAAWEQKLGEAAFVQFSLGHKFLADDELKRQLDQLAAPLLAVVPQDRYPFTLHLVEDPSLNAFALPGGKVMLHSGLLLAADSPEEILGVLAHELAHVTRQHGVRGIVSNLGLYAVVTFFVGDVSGVAAILVNNAPFLLTQKFSRDHEREADEQGFRYLEAAGLNPRGLITFFDKVRAEEDSLKSKVPGGQAMDALGFLSTHPATTERQARLERLIAESGRRDAFKAVDLDFAAFQQLLRSKLSLTGSATNSAAPPQAQP
jgi:predicted Zn-dependent protease